MARKEKEYHRLASARMTFGMRVSLWRGRDHLLKVTSSNFTEDYRRFYFKDIQSITILKTNNGFGWTVVMAILTVLCLVIAFAIGGMGGAIFCVIVISFLVLILAINVALGPTCKCWIRTAVKSERIESLGRLRKARKVLAALRPFILEAQGELTAEERAAAEAQQPESPAVSQAPAVATPFVEKLLVGIEQEDPFPHPAAQVSVAQPATVVAPEIAPAAVPPPLVVKTPCCLPAFCLLILEGLIAGIDIAAHGAVMMVVENIMVSALAIMAIIALARLPHLGITARVRSTLIATMIFLFLQIFVGTIAMMVLVAAHHPPMANDQWEMLKWCSRQSVLKTPFLLGLDLTVMVIDLLLGLYGLLALARFRRLTEPPQALPAIPPAPPRQES